jgi:AMMECR1 domain-containing protein
VLSPFKRIADLGDFRVNEHGALLEAGMHHGLLLPQVATERNWNAQQFLDALTHKTGVSRDVYCDPSTRVYVFRAQVIQ